MGAPWRSRLTGWPCACLGRSRSPLPRCLSHILEELKRDTRAEVMVASHNEDTVRFTLCR